MLTIGDFKKRTNKNMPSIFNYEYRENDKVYSIFKMMGPLKVSIESKAVGGGFWKESGPQEIDNIEEGLEFINEYRLKGGK